MNRAYRSAGLVSCQPRQTALTPQPFGAFEGDVLDRYPTVVGKARDWIAINRIERGEDDR